MPDTFSRSEDCHRTGKYCELLVISACVEDGAAIALPFGNQAGWDILVKENGRWMEMQVKTATANKYSGFYCNVRRFSSSSRKGRLGTASSVYQVGDTDYIVPVMPETGTIWKVPIAVAAGKACVRLTDEFLWKPGTPLIRPVKSSKRPNRTCKTRRLLSATKPTHKPDRIKTDTWDMIEMFSAGTSRKDIGLKHGLDESSVKHRIERAIKKFTPTSTADLLCESQP